MNRADAALFESIAVGMQRRPLPEAVRRRGDKIAPGKNLPGLSTFTTKSKGGKEEEGTAFKAKTADGKVVPIIMRGEAGKGGTAEVIIPGGKRVSLSIQQASKLRQNISMYDLKDVPKLVAAIRKGDKLPESVDPIEDKELIEKAPPGWAGTVKAMKKHMDDDKAFALAWHGYKSGKEPHYKDDGQSTTSEGEPKKKKKFKGEEAGMHEEKDPNLKPGQQVTYKTLDMGNNERKSVGISRETGTEDFTAVSLSRSKGGFKTFKGAKKWLEKATGKKLVGGIVESVDGDDEFQASPDAMYSAIVQKLGGMQGPEQVLKTISSMYSTGDVPAAVYAAAAGMARAEQNLSVPLAKAMNQLSAEDVAAAIAKGLNATKSPTIKNMEQWWMSEIAKLSGTDRDGQNSPVRGALPAEVQPYIDSMAVEAIDSVFEQAMSDSGCELPIGSGALSGPEAIGTAAGYEEPMEVPGADLSSESPINPGEAAAAIQNGVPRSNETERARSHDTRMPGEGRIKPGQYTAEEFDALPFKDRIRMAEAYDRLMGDAPDMGQEEVVDAESYKAMLRNRHSNPNGSTTPVVSPEGSNGAVVVDDVEDVDNAFAAVAGGEDNQAA